MMRLPAAQRWPASMNADATACSAASVRSASSQTTSGFLPPSSRQTFASTAPLADGLLNQLARSPTDPVKLTRPTRRSCDERRADLRAESLHDASTRRAAGRRPSAACRTRPRCTASARATSTTTALPHSSAGNTFHAMPASGLLNGMIAAQTPIGARIGPHRCDSGSGSSSSCRRTGCPRSP